jgi:preprotein translocase subunit YajC
MVKLITLTVFVGIILLGYFTYVDSQQRKQQEMLNIIKEANLTIKNVEANPNNHSILEADHSTI